ncbi:MAG TPA: LuxR C-terminal-related transcriptional regulator [Verrucomicrobiae bacterium]|nr:LuxR C-terminal-related transcriptional regulator [Verrucomicrobiae bacterium]
MNLAYDTVQWHIRNIYEKLHVRSRSEAVARYRPKDPF